MKINKYLVGVLATGALMGTTACSECIRRERTTTVPIGVHCSRTTFLLSMDNFY